VANTFVAVLRKPLDRIKGLEAENKKLKELTPLFNYLFNSLARVSIWDII
jgi:hypothetical protein